MRFTIITAFPDFFRDFLSTSIVGRAVKAGLFQVEAIDLRSFGKGAYRQIDDYAFGGGGMVLAPKPLKDALNAVSARTGEQRQKPFLICPTPQGALLTQETVETLYRQPHVVIVCGHYEGIDERFIEGEVDLEVSIGDCVLTGGEIPAMVVIDAVSRLIPGVVGKSGAVKEDSFYRGMLDHPHYTRPSSWEGRGVPEALLSGDAGDIDAWRRKEAVARTVTRRPDLLAKSDLGYYAGEVYVVIECGSARHVGEWAKLCESYGVSRLLLAMNSPEKREILRQDLGESSGVKLMPSLEYAVDWAAKKGKKGGRGKGKNLPLLVEVPNSEREGARHWLDVKRLVLEKGGPVLFYLFEDDRSAEKSDAIRLVPLQEGKLPFYGKLAALLDRFLGSR
ncbi:MAG: tRNA (guanosine(37)-N1)-methyltransferase TrmD [Synergistaceae bacterium]|jgi:tRNA (guanine37-N1)-methyltransferase|nr:tRNA (guanosine(37)-N1)-methyltransferase TrmD [Synergistaceae bacterium]